MKAFDCIAARNTAHAVALLAEHGSSARVLAGGTDLLVDLKSALDGPRIVIDLSHIEELRRIERADDGLRIGALVTHTDIMRSPAIRDLCPALVDAAHTIGAVQTRNLGTLGGNLVTGVPSMDSGPALLALDARVTLAGEAGRREMSLEEFFVGPRKTALKPDELLVDIRIPRQNFGKPLAFLKFGLRKGQALALVNVAAGFRIDENKHAFRAPCIALGAVAPTVIRAREAERYLEGRSISTEAMAEAARIAVTAAKPISDFRSSAAYRRDLIEVLTRRALEQAHARAHTATRELSA